MVRGRHAAYYLGLAEQAAAAVWGPHVFGRFGQTEHAQFILVVRELDNLRAALTWAAERREAEIFARLGIALWAFWFIEGYRRGLAMDGVGPGAADRAEANAPRPIAWYCGRAGVLAWGQRDAPESLDRRVAYVGALNGTLGVVSVAGPLLLSQLSFIIIVTSVLTTIWVFCICVELYGWPTRE
jgi:hypothetical protein